MQDVIFREYDIRGKVNSELVIEEVAHLAHAIAYYMLQENPAVKTLAVGMDGRLHSPQIKDQLVKGLNDSGLDVVFVGVCPSPALYFALHTMQVDGGIMITASHNPKEYNGMKLCLGKEVIWGDKIRKIGQLYKEGKYTKAEKRGAYQERSIIDSYVSWLGDHFKHLDGMDLSAVIDCGNGAGGTVMPQLLKKLNWKNVRLLYQEVDGNYPHHEADPVIEANMADVKNILATTDIQVGIGLDGDCDRMAPMTKEGFLVPGDQLLALFAQQVLKDHPGAAVVFDIKSSSGLIELLEKWGARPFISPSGHSIIKDKMKEQGALLGGELSCHFFFNDRYFGYDDGIYSILRLMEMLARSGKSLSALLRVFPKKFSSPEIRIACKEEEKQMIVKAVKDVFAQRNDASLITIDGVRASMPYGWGIVRASNTKAELTIRFESDSEEGLGKVKEDFYKVLKPYFDDRLLQQRLGL